MLKVALQDPYPYLINSLQGLRAQELKVALQDPYPY
jgi:hypothetical protein